MRLNEGASKRPAPESEAQTQVPSKKIKLTQTCLFLTDAFSLRKEIPKQPNLDYSQICPICNDEFRNCMKNKTKLSTKKYFAQHLRECMLFAPEKELKRLGDSFPPETTDAFLESLLKRLNKYRNMEKICKLECAGIARVLEIAFGKEKVCASEDFLTSRASQKRIVFQATDQNAVNAFFGVGGKRA